MRGERAGRRGHGDTISQHKLKTTSEYKVVQVGGVRHMLLLNLASFASLLEAVAMVEKVKDGRLVSVHS